MTSNEYSEGKQQCRRVRSSHEVEEAVNTQSDLQAHMYTLSLSHTHTPLSQKKIVWARNTKCWLFCFKLGASCGTVTSHGLHSPLLNWLMESFNVAVERGYGERKGRRDIIEWEKRVKRGGNTEKLWMCNGRYNMWGFVTEQLSHFLLQQLNNINILDCSKSASK